MKQTTKHHLETIRGLSKTLLKLTKQFNELIQYLAEIDDQLEKSLKNGNGE